MKDLGPIITIDLSKTSTGVAIGSAGEVPNFSTHHFGGTKHFGEADDFRDGWWRVEEWLSDAIVLHRPHSIWVEAPPRPGSFGGSTDAENTLWIVGAWATLCNTARRYGVMWREANVKSARLQFLGTGNLKSAEAKREAKRVCKAIGWNPSNADEADAGCVFWNAVKILAPSLAPDVKPFRYQRVEDDGTISFKPPKAVRKTRSEAEVVFSSISKRAA